MHEHVFVAAALIGAGLVVAGLTRWWGMARLLTLMPWNRAAPASHPPACGPRASASTPSKEVSQ